MIQLTVRPFPAAIAIGLVTLGATVAHAQQGFTIFGEGTPIDAQQRTVRPLSAPYFHEDSFVTTDVRAWYVNHHFYGDTIGGDVSVYAAQLRVAITDSLQFVAYKDGYTDFDDTLGNESGWNDLAAGLKWAFLQDWDNQFHMAAGIGYEFALGDHEILQDTNELRLWLSANKSLGRLNLGAVANYRLANSKWEGVLGSADMITLHVHADYRLNDWFSPVIELNGYFVTDEGPAGVPFSGVDAVAIGGGDGEDTITAAIGGEFRPFGPELGLRAAYETELSSNHSLFGHRWTLSAVYEF